MPVKPFRNATVIVEMVDALTVTVEGVDAVREKSVIWKVAVAVRVRLPLVPVIVTM